MPSEGVEVKAALHVPNMDDPVLPTTGLVGQPVVRKKEEFDTSGTHMGSWTHSGTQITYTSVVSEAKSEF